MLTLSVVRLNGVELAVRLGEPWAGRLRRARRALRGGQPRARTDAAPQAAAECTAAARALQEQVATAEWYHTIDLGHGVVTPGFFDHRPVVSRYHLPDAVNGARVLDVATYNGFWAFEFERRGAAEVVATDIARMADIDLAPARRAAMTPAELACPTGTGFEIAAAALRSSVRREVCDVYDLDPARFGQFDLVMCSDLLLHLTNPVRALQRIRAVTRGHAIIADLYDPRLDRSGTGLVQYRGGMGDFIWWTFSVTALEAMIRDAGFSQVEVVDRFELPARGWTERVPPHVVFRATP